MDEDLTDLTVTVNFRFLGGPLHNKVMKFSEKEVFEGLKLAEKSSVAGAKSYVTLHHPSGEVYIADMYEKNKHALLEGLDIEALWQVKWKAV